MVEIRLNENEQKIVEDIAKKRYSSARAKGFIDIQKSNHTKFKIDHDGFGGEFAFCKWDNIYPSFITGKTDKWDCVSSDGTKVDVKTTDNQNGNLLVQGTKEIDDVDVYFLVIKISNELFNIVGYEDSKNVICDKAYQLHQNHPSLKGEGYFVHRKDLYKV